MRNILRNLQVTALALIGITAATAANAQARLEARMLVVTEVIEEQQQQIDQRIPQYLLQRAYGIAVFPGVDKIAFVLGGRRGSGVMSVRDDAGQFTNPVFVTLTGGGVGWQAGYQKSDVVLVFTTRKGVEQFNSGTVTLGGNASVAAGPLGRAGEAAISNSAEVFSYSRNKGLFAGVSLDGTALSVNHRENRLFYKQSEVDPEDIISGRVNRNDLDSVRRFLAALTSAAGGSAPSGASRAEGDNANGSTLTPEEMAARPPEASSSEGVRTFPMEDRSPGAEPGP
jgi:lipid-binding SYLF domain-containing protein